MVYVCSDHSMVANRGLVSRLTFDLRARLLPGNRGCAGAN
jgi:hypothetical protein